jgi:hypothetical protein
MVYGLSGAAPYIVVGTHTQNVSLSGTQVVTLPTGANGILVQAITQNVRVTLDGTAPTAIKGFQIKASDPPILFSLPSDGTITAIQETASGTLEMQAVNISPYIG